jgi:hypothetical protein
VHNKERIRAGKVRIRLIFLEDWDPIGLGEYPQAQDEYDSYLGGVYKLLVQGASVPEIVRHLNEIECVSMGLTPDELRLVAVAEKLKALCLSE